MNGICDILKDRAEFQMRIGHLKILIYGRGRIELGFRLKPVRMKRCGDALLSMPTLLGGVSRPLYHLQI